MTDVGQARESNEDSYFISQAEPLCIVADGMGGHNSGEIASAFAVHSIREYYERSATDPSLEGEVRNRLPAWPFKRRPPEHPEERRLVQAVLLANEMIFRHAAVREDYKGMGTTLVGAYFVEGGMFLIHVGDSRAYRIRGNLIERITRDHSLADEYVQMGILREEELAIFPYKNVITRALGLSEVIEPEVRFYTLQHGDTFVFCSDGLTDPLDDGEIQTIVSGFGPDIETAARTLIAAANAAGGPDNVTAVIAQTTTA